MPALEKGARQGRSTAHSQSRGEAYHVLHVFGRQSLISCPNAGKHVARKPTYPYDGKKSTFRLDSLGSSY